MKKFSTIQHALMAGKKLLLSVIAISISATVFAIDWDSYAWLGDGAGGGAYSEMYKVAPAEGQNVVNIQKPGFAAEDGIYTNFPAGISACSLGEGNYAIQGAGMVLYLSAFTKQETEVSVTAADVNYVFTVYYADGTPSGTPSKASAELTLNVTDTTLDAAVSETFQIVATRKGDGAISYESNNAGIASVSANGLVTAVGRGTAVITVKVAETETYEAGSKKLTVTVNGPVNWEAVEWLAGGNNKYKVVTEPEIPNQFGGKHIENNNLWIGFPSAVFGENTEVEYTTLGAGVSFPLSQFPKEFNEFHFICDGTTYKIILYYADGETDTTAIERLYNNETRTRKVIENGTIVIIKDGIRYNALGTKL